MSENTAPMPEPMIGTTLIEELRAAKDFWMACSDAYIEKLFLRAADALEQAEQREQWQDIATAPTNTAILIFIPNAEHYGPGIYRAILCDMGTGRHWFSSAWACGRDLSQDEFPMKWKPLPVPPESS